MTFKYPLQGGSYRLSHGLGRFGRRKGTPHNGVDLFANSGTPVLAVLDGVVEEANEKDKKGWGNQILLKHETPDGTYYTRYAHLKRMDVSPGDRVSKGSRIGYSGGGANDPGKGNSDGPHLHFELLNKSKKPIDPEQFLKGSAILGAATVAALATSGSDDGDDETNGTKTKSSDSVIDKVLDAAGKVFAPVGALVSLKGLTESEQSRITEDIDRIKDLMK
jgi:Peptidase family M23